MWQFDSFYSPIIVLISGTPDNVGEGAVQQQDETSTEAASAVSTDPTKESVTKMHDDEAPAAPSTPQVVGSAVVKPIDPDTQQWESDPWAEYSPPKPAPKK